MTSVSGYGVKADSKALDTVILIGGLAALAGIGYMLWKTKQAAEGIVNAPGKAAEAIAQATKTNLAQDYLKTLPIPMENFTPGTPGYVAQQQEIAIRNKAITEGVAARYDALSLPEKALVSIGEPIVGTAATTARQNIVNALQSLSFNNAGYVERWIDSLSWDEKLTIGIESYGNTPLQTIRDNLGGIFKAWLSANYDANGNPIAQPTASPTPASIVDMVFATNPVFTGVNQVRSWLGW